MTGDWNRFLQYVYRNEALGLQLDSSRMGFADDFFERMRPALDRAFAAMRELEAGGVANPDEGRMVGHYWLRAPELAPTVELCREIEETDARVRRFAYRVHHGEIQPSSGGR